MAKAKTLKSKAKTKKATKAAPKAKKAAAKKPAAKAKAKAKPKAAARKKAAPKPRTAAPKPAPPMAPEVDDIEDVNGAPEAERWGEPVPPATPVTEPVEGDGDGEYEDDEMS